MTGLVILVATVISGCGPLSKKRSSDSGVKENLKLNSDSYDKSHCQILTYQDPAYSLLAQLDEGTNLRLDAIRKRLPPGLELQVMDESGPQIDAQGRYHIPLLFSYEGTKLNSSQFHASAHDRDNSLWIKGRIPTPELLERGVVIHAQVELTNDIVTKEIQDLLGQTFNSLRFSSGESRLLEVDQQLHMSTELALTIDGKPYEAADVAGKIYNLSPLFLHATGQFNIYEGGNSLSQQLKEMIIDDMQEGGYLCSPQFTVNTDQEELTYSPDHHFKFDPSDKRFKESVAFANATQMMDWFLTMDKGAHWSGAQVELRLTEEPSKAGPMYANPKSSKTQKRPVIFLPDEMTSPFDTKPVLKNLATDFDVVAHELGHHIVGQYLSFANKPESIMVNEGLADFFVYAKTGSSCLAESICTAESHVCQIPGHCLRTADVVLDITDPKFAHLEVHFQSEVVSGMLWELGSSQLGLANTARLTMQAIRYLNKITDVSDLLTSLLQADRDLFEGQNNCAIQAVAKKRGIMNDSSNSVACK